MALESIDRAKIRVQDLSFFYGSKQALKNNHLETVLNKSLATDLDTVQSILKLIKGSYLRRITSYNVCYTKLLRRPSTRALCLPARPQAFECALP